MIEYVNRMFRLQIVMKDGDWDMEKTPMFREIRRKKKEIDIDAVIDSGYIRELIEKEQKTLFPKVISTERPDQACTALLDGKIVILVENSPFVLILPAVLSDFFKSPQDEYQKSFNASFNRIIRMICFFLALLTPALYIALMTYNQEIIPDQLLISLSAQREGVPFPAFFEAPRLSFVPRPPSRRDGAEAVRFSCPTPPRAGFTRQPSPYPIRSSRPHFLSASRTIFAFSGRLNCKSARCICFSL